MNSRGQRWWLRKCERWNYRLGTQRKRGNRRGAAHAHNVKQLRDREIDIARHAEQAYERFVRGWQRHRPAKRHKDSHGVEERR